MNKENKENKQNNNPTDNPTQQDQSPKSVNILSTDIGTEQPEEKPIKKVKRQATQEQLDHPLHGVKMKVVLQRLVDHCGWD